MFLGNTIKFDLMKRRSGHPLSEALPADNMAAVIDAHWEVGEKVCYGFGGGENRVLVLADREAAFANCLH
jgi:hypothetical protein